MTLRTLAAATLVAASLFAQQPAAPAAPATPALPAAGSAEATALVDKALAKMQAYGRGTFKTTESNDLALLRGQGLPFGNDDTEVEGGWHGGMLWAEHDGKHWLKANGRMLAKVGGTWKLRGSKLDGGAPAPFTLDPELLFTALATLPADARKVAHVEAGEIGGKPVAILSLALAGDVAADFAQSGAVPGGGGGGGFFMLAGPGGMDMPENEYVAYVALAIDPASGDLLRCSSKVYETNEMMGNVQIQVAGGGGGDDEDEADEKEEPADAPLTWKKGLPTKKPGKQQSVATFRVDFKQLGLADAPALDDTAKALLRMR